MVVGNELDQTCVVYVTDEGFLGPSIASAISVELQSATCPVDILVLTIGVSSRTIDLLNSRLKVNRISLIPLKTRAYVPDSRVVFAKGHIPHASLARLVAGPEIPSRFRRVLYLDGDTLALGDMTPLVCAPMRPGRILAGRGSEWLSGSETDRGYLDAVGVSADSYFNAGVLGMTRDTLIEYGPRALESFMIHSTEFVRHDQSALNNVFAGAVDYIHPSYNFHSAYQALNARGEFQPAIVHFTGRRKPWKSQAPRRITKFAIDYDVAESLLRDTSVPFVINNGGPLGLLRDSLDWLASGSGWRNDLRIKRNGTVEQFRDYWTNGEFAVYSRGKHL